MGRRFPRLRAARLRHGIRPFADLFCTDFFTGSPHWSRNLDGGGVSSAEPRSPYLMRSCSMLVTVTRCAAAAAVIAVVGVAVPASAAPIGGGLALKNAAPAVTETVQWRGRGYGWHGGGGYWRGGRYWGPAAGF